MKETEEAYFTKERVALLLSNLEKLKTEVSVIEARYDVLHADYTKICEDAISRISTIKTDYDKNLDNEITNPEILKLEMDNLEARFKLGLVPDETYLEQRAFLNGEDIPAPPGILQTGIDKTANCIEFGLDKIGDWIIFPIEKTVNLCTALYKLIKSKVKR